MNPLSELKERLVYISVAGTQLLQEDFRLKKAIQSFEPLVEKNPVFKKIYTDLEKLMSAEKDQQAVLTLNLLGLIDAVLYTQATTTIDGDFVELPESEKFGKTIQIRYSQINPLIQALTTKGSGRIDVLNNTIYDHSEYFADYRVLHALINDLNDSYSEMADEVFNILKSLGTNQKINKYNPEYLYGGGYDYRIDYFKDFELPKIDKKQLVAQLKNNFDLEGKKEMAKRVYLVSAIAGESENDWYIYLIENSKKDIQEAAVFALACSDKNIPFLLDLVKKEKGKAKDAAYKVLSKWDIPELFDFWEKEIEKNIKVVPKLKFSTSDKVSDIIADKLTKIFAEIFDKKEAEPKETEEISLLLDSASNKTSDKMLEFYEWCADNEKNFPKMKVGTTYYSSPSRYNVLSNICTKMTETLLITRSEKMIKFLQSLKPSQREKYNYPCFLADIITLPAKEFYDRWANKDLDVSYTTNISCKGDKYEISSSINDYTFTANGDYTIIKQEIAEPLDERWYDFFISKDWNNVLSRLTPKDSKEVCEKVGQYFYKRALAPAPKGQHYVYNELFTCLSMMNFCGMKDYKGAVLSHCKKYNTVYEWNVKDWLEDYKRFAGEESAKEEAKRVIEYYEKNKSGKIKAESLKELLIEHGFLDK